HDVAALDGWPDHLLDMVGARCGKQQSFHLRAESLGRARQDDVAYRFRAGRTAGLPRDGQPIALRAKLGRQQLDLRRLAGALATFEAYEKSARQFICPCSDRNCGPAPVTPVLCRWGRNVHFYDDQRIQPMSNSPTASRARLCKGPSPTLSAAQSGV